VLKSWVTGKVKGSLPCLLQILQYYSVLDKYSEYEPTTEGTVIKVGSQPVQGRFGLLFYVLFSDLV
jgi:hypothetical protein